MPQAAFDAHENIQESRVAEIRALAKAEGLWAFQMPKERGGAGLGVMGMAACMKKRHVPPLAL